MAAIARESIKLITEFSDQSLANMAWAFATLGIHDLPLLDAISAESIKKLSEFGQQQLANLVWAYATLGYTNLPLIDALAAEAIKKIKEFKPQGIANTAWAYSKLGMINKPLMEALAEEAIKKIFKFDPQNISNTAWAYAKCGLTHAPLMEALSAAAIRMINDLGTRECANIAWAFSTLKIHDDTLMDAISAAVIAKISDCEALDMATIAWSFDNLKMLNGPLRNAISAQALKKIESLESQPLATLVDVGLSCKDALEKRLEDRVARFCKAWLAADPFAIDACHSVLQELQVDNFGMRGNDFLLARVGIKKAEATFHERGALKISEAISARDPEWKQKRVFFKDRVFCYAEYAFKVHLEGVGQVEGTMMKENSFQGIGTRAGRTGLLKELVLPINELVDRSLCAEYQLLSEMCDSLDDAGVCGSAQRKAVTGYAALFTSGASCLSCVGVMRQFLCLYPGVSMTIACAKR